MFVCVTFPSSTGGRGVRSANLCDGHSRLRSPPAGSEMVSGGRKAGQLRAATSLGAQTAAGRDKAVLKDQASELDQPCQVQKGGVILGPGILPRPATSLALNCTRFFPLKFNFT